MYFGDPETEWVEVYNNPDPEAPQSERIKWRFKGGNGEPVARGEGYGHIGDLLDAVRLVTRRVPTFVETKSADVDHGKIRVVDLRKEGTA